ncbi:hypothetical protein ABZP36_003862 [Zizania latifolia]
MRRSAARSGRSCTWPTMPWSFPAPEIEKLFAQCGAVKDVEVRPEGDGRKKGFAFVTMATAKEAAAAVGKLLPRAYGETNLFEMAIK